MNRSKDYRIILNDIISKEEDNNLKNKIIDYYSENCLDTLTKLKNWFKIAHPNKKESFIILFNPNYLKNIQF